MPDHEIDPRAITTIPGMRYTLVLDDEHGAIAAAALLTIKRGKGHVDAIAVAREHEREGLLDRMFGVVASICAAFGAALVDLRAT